MAKTQSPDRHSGLPILRGVLPLKIAQLPAEIVAGLTLAALAIPEVMGYAKISGAPVITGLYTGFTWPVTVRSVQSSRGLTRRR